MESPAKTYSFDILCPCGCKNGFEIEVVSMTGNLDEMGNEIWKAFVAENGLEKSIEILHSRADEEDEEEEDED